MKEIDGKILRKYQFQDFYPIFIDFTYPYPAPLYIPVRRVCYEIETKHGNYSLTLESCDIPLNAEIKIKIERGRFLKKIFLLYENKEFPVVSLTPLRKQ